MDALGSRLTSLLLALAMTLALLVPGLARAASCPAAFSAYDCEVGGTDVCTTSPTTFRCDISGEDVEEGGAVTMVEDYDATADFEAWGEKNGELFCCTSDGQEDPTIFEIVGSAYDDVLEFTWDSLAYNLAPTDGVSTITATIDGNEGADTIKGSHASVRYSETLNGDDGPDTISGNGDGDVIDGGAGNDVLIGGSGDDTMTGGSGNDEMIGGDGADVMDGGDGHDLMSGGPGDDTMDGGAGGDVMCGDGEGSGDTLDDGDSTEEEFPDVLWSAISIDDITCGHESTLWDCEATPHGSCGSTCITTRPTGCP